MLDRIKNICTQANVALKAANEIGKSIDKKVDKLTVDQKTQIQKTLDQLNTSQNAIKNYRVPFLRRLFCLLIGERGIGTKVNNAIQDLNLLNQKPVEEKKAEVEVEVEKPKAEEPEVEVEVEKPKAEEPEVEVEVEKPKVEEQVEEAEVELKAEEKPVEEEQVEEAKVEVKAEEPKAEEKPVATPPKDLWRAAEEATQKQKEAEDKRKEKFIAEFAGVDPEKPGPGTPAVRSKTPQKLGKIAPPPERQTIRKEEFENLDPTKKGPSVTDRLKGWWTKQ